MQFFLEEALGGSRVTVDAEQKINLSPPKSMGRYE
jgi:hypothetical protein